MGKNTFNMVSSFAVKWPYPKPVFVVSNSLTKIPNKFEGKVQLIKGSVEEILKVVHFQGYKNLYIDGGINIQNFLNEDKINEIIIAVIPVLLGGGTPLFSTLSNKLDFECISSKVDKGIVQNHYRRIK